MKKSFECFSKDFFIANGTFFRYYRHRAIILNGGSKMKKLISLILILVLAVSLCASALAADIMVSPHTLTIDGKTVDCRAYAIDGHNYYRLRDLAAALSGTVNCFNVEYDTAADAVVITTGKNYADPTPLVSYNVPNEPYVPSTEPQYYAPSVQKLVVNGKTVTGIDAWAIDGNNYFKLRDLQPILGFELDYDDTAKEVQITTTEPVAVNAEDYAAVFAAVKSAGGSSAVRGGIAVTEAADAAMGVPAPAEAPAADDNYAAAETKAEEGAGAGYSGTNVQVEGIDEGDIVKTDGEYIYVLRSGNELTILKADGKNTKVISRTVVGSSDYYENDSDEAYLYRYEDRMGNELFVSGDRLAVIGEYYHYEESKRNGKYDYDSENYAFVDVYDISDPAAPKLLSRLGQDGYIRDTRLLDGKVYAVSTYWVWDSVEEDPVTYVPSLYKAGTASVMPADCIYISPCCESTEYVVLCSYDLESAAAAECVSLLGGGDQIYMNDSSIYVFGSRWMTEESRQYRESVYTVTVYSQVF